MLNCERFQLQAGADPQHLSWRLRLHWLGCRVCAQYLRAMRALDRRIARALDVSLSPKAGTVTTIDWPSGPRQPPLR